jgi:hypothetical protein
MVTDIKQVLSEYRMAAVGVSCPDPKKANKCYKRVHACYKLLRQSETGRQMIMSLMSDEEPGVRCAAASHSLQWDETRARQILEQLRDSHGPFSFTSKMVLIEHDKGALTFDD